MKRFLIAGLGNPGEEYANSRHNAGADFIDLLCKKHSLSLENEKQISGAIAKLKTEEYELIFVVPSTYMNESGICISKSKKFFNLNTEEILVAHDELDLPKSAIRLKESGGHGGHNGLRNIIDHLKGDNTFKRLRIGIGKPEKENNVISYVLKKAPLKDREDLKEQLSNYLNLGEEILMDGWQKTVMKYHTSREEEGNES